MGRHELPIGIGANLFEEYEVLTMTSRTLAKIFKALGDETRLEIVKMLAGKERCVCAFLSNFI